MNPKLAQALPGFHRDHGFLQLSRTAVRQIRLISQAVFHTLVPLSQGKRVPPPSSGVTFQESVTAGQPELAGVSISWLLLVISSVPSPVSFYAKRGNETFELVLSSVALFFLMLETVNDYVRFHGLSLSFLPAFRC